MPSLRPFTCDDPDTLTAFRAAWAVRNAPEKHTRMAARRLAKHALEMLKWQRMPSTALH